MSSESLTTLTDDALQPTSTVSPAKVDILDRLGGRSSSCLGSNLRMAARAISSVYDDHLKNAGIQASQLSVLWTVCAAHGITVKEMAARMAIHQTTLIRNLRVLEREGWIELTPGRADRRERIASLTANGRTVLARGLASWERAQAELKRLLNVDLAELNRRLIRVSRAATDA